MTEKTRKNLVYFFYVKRGAELSARPQGLVFIEGMDDLEFFMTELHETFPLYADVFNRQSVQKLTYKSILRLLGVVLTKEFIFEYVDCTSCTEYYTVPAMKGDPAERGCWDGDMGKDHLCLALSHAMNHTFRQDILDSYFAHVDVETRDFLEDFDLWEALKEG
jgi:hypothetical protein